MDLTNLINCPRSSSDQYLEDLIQNQNGNETLLLQKGFSQNEVQRVNENNVTFWETHKAHLPSDGNLVFLLGYLSSFR